MNTMPFYCAVPITSRQKIEEEVEKLEVQLKEVKDLLLKLQPTDSRPSNTQGSSGEGEAPM